MKKFLISALTIAISTNVANAQKIVRTSNGIKVNTGGQNVEVQFFSPSIVRVLKTHEKDQYSKKSLVVTKIPQKTELTFRQQPVQYFQRQSSLLHT
jgi:alpha-D-xyloside xylohydrolase